MTSLIGLFERPEWLVATILGPMLVVVLVISRQQRRRARLAKLGPPSIVGRLVPNASRDSGVLRAILLGGATLSAGVALAGPRWGNEQRLEHGSGIDVVLALDASLSMMARDERPNRLERMKEEVRRLRDLSPGDRTALIAFAGRSYVLTPLTVDDGALDLFLENLDPSVVGQPGTALARAIRQGTDLLLATRTASDRALVLMSDGEGFDDESDLRAAAQAAKENGVSVVTVGFGTEAGTTIPITGGTPGDTLKRDENGDVVVTHYTPKLLETIADAGHGVFISASETDKAVKIRNALNKLRTQERALERGQSLAPQFQLFLAPAVLFLLLDTFLADRTRVRLRRTSAVAVTAVALGFVQGPAQGSTDSVPPPQTFKQLVDKGDHTARTMYNYGTSLLASDSMDAAVSALSLVASDREPEVRYRALFNLGLAHLKRGLGESGDNARSELDMALAAYKRVLLMRSADSDAKWNYELALQAKQSGGGGSSQQPKNNPRQQNQQPRQGDQPEGQLGKRQAEEILKSAAREERDVEGKRQKEAATDVPPLGKDW